MASVISQESRLNWIIYSYGSAYSRNVVVFKIVCVFSATGTAALLEQEQEQVDKIMEQVRVELKGWLCFEFSCQANYRTVVFLMAGCIIYPCFLSSVPVCVCVRACVRVCVCVCVCR